EVAHDVVGAVDVAVEGELAGQHPGDGETALPDARAVGGRRDGGLVGLVGGDGRRVHVDAVLGHVGVAVDRHGAAVGPGDAEVVGVDLPHVAGPAVGLELDDAVVALATGG